MSDEWVEKLVADLEVGDKVKDYGVIVRKPERSPLAAWDESIVTFSLRGALALPAHARVDVRRPVEVTTHPWLGAHGIRRAHIYIGKQFVGSLALQPAEEYAERLRGSADERRKALGETS